MKKTLQVSTQVTVSQNPMVLIQSSQTTAEIEEQPTNVKMWTIWLRRNAFRTSDKPFLILRVLRDARSAQASYVRSIPPKPPDHGSLAHQHTGWTPLVNHMFKVNFDRAIFRKEQKAGVGVIIRDEHGSVIASMEDGISLPFSVDAVKAFAAKEALKFTQEHGLSTIVLEGDSKRTIDSLLSRTYP